MKMGRFEKWFINAAGHSRHVTEAAARRLPIVPFGATLKYLDVGCGNGAAALHLAATYGFEVIGIDVDPEQIRLAQVSAGDRSVVRFLVADATRLPFETAEFDVVATNKTTHHIPEWKAALSENGPRSPARGARDLRRPCGSAMAGANRPVNARPLRRFRDARRVGQLRSASRVDGRSGEYALRELRGRVA